MDGFDAGRGRWIVGGCFAIFAVPFFIAGVAIINTGLRELNRGQRDAAILLGAGIAFTAFSAGIVALVWYGLRRAQAAAQLRAAHPMQPWLWRADWSARRIEESATSRAAALLVFALMWNAIALPLLLVLGRRVAGNPPAAIAVVFAAIGVALLGGGIYAALRRHKFGRSVCEIDRLPIEPGQRVSGAIALRGTQVPESGYRLVLSCINRIITGCGKNRSVTDDVLWDAEQQVSGALAAPSPDGMRVPFSFDVPADAPSSEVRTPSDAVLWQLAVTAELPGIDYAATFELPVFATAGDAAAHHAIHREEAARRELSPKSRVSIAPLPSGGIELRVAPLRDARAFATFFIVAAVWFGMIAFMWTMGAPRPVSVFFVLFGLLILAVAIDFFAGSSMVSADRAGIRARHSILGLSSTKSIDAQQIASIDPKVGGHVGKHPYFDVEARLADQSTRTLARYFESRGDAEIVAAKLWAALLR